MSALVHLLCAIVCSFHFAETGEVKVVEPCTGSTIALSCPQDTRIHVQQVLLADSSCFKALSGRCCPASSDCTGQPSDGHRRTVESRCNGQKYCSVGVEVKKFDCSGRWINNDYERVKYECVGVTTTRTTATTAVDESTPGMNRFQPEMEFDGMTTLATSKSAYSKEKDGEIRMRPQVQSIVGSSPVSSTNESETATFKWSYVVFVSATVITIFILLVVMNVCLWIRLKGRRYPIADGSKSPDIELTNLESLIRPTAVVRACSSGLACANDDQCAGVDGAECCSQQPSCVVQRQTLSAENPYDTLYDFNGAPQMTSSACQSSAKCTGQQQIDEDEYLMPLVDFESQTLKHPKDDEE